MKIIQKYSYSTLSVELVKPFIYHVILNRPKKRNAIDNVMFKEIQNCFNELSKDPECRVVILSGSGELFCAGIDFESLLGMSHGIVEHEDVGRRAKFIFNYVKQLQESVSALELCSKPVLITVHSGCIGAGLDLISAGDIRYCSKDSWFEAREVRLGMAADLGTLQRFPKVIKSDSLARELCLTGRKFDANEAAACGFVSKTFDTKENMMLEVFSVAEKIAANSPVAVQVTKNSMVYSRDHPVQDSLQNILIWNQLMLQSEDLYNTIAASMNRDNKQIIYAKL